MLTRINKVIADAGVASRREADRLIKGGYVTVNGKPVLEPGIKCDPEKDHIKVKSKLIKPETKKIYVLLNKPKGVVTTTKDPENRKTVMDLVRNVPGRLFPVGRLDLQTEGLIIMTNDGEFADRIMRPSSKVPKVYEVKIKGKINENLKRKIQYGITVEGVKLKLDKVEIIKTDLKNDWLRVTILEGKNRQIRKVFDAIRHSVVKLKRVQIGNLRAGLLAPGEYMLLEKKHIKKIFERSK